MTVNYSWRTALHKDSGDLEEGFGNLIVCEDDQNPNKFGGSYLGFPQFGVAVDVRQGDFLAMDVHQWHANTEYKHIGKFIDTTKKNTIRGTQTKQNGWYFNRLSIVLYYRKKMIRCKDESLTKNKSNAKQLQKSSLEVSNDKSQIGGSMKHSSHNIYNFQQFFVIDDL